MNDEIQLYLSNQVSPLKSDPLVCWEEMMHTFPLLYKQTRLHFTIITTSAPCKRLFSKIGATISQARNRLGSFRLAKLLSLNNLPDNYWF